LAATAEEISGQAQQLLSAISFFEIEKRREAARDDRTPHASSVLRIEA
jgi:hypothetical protein